MPPCQATAIIDDNQPFQTQPATEVKVQTPHVGPRVKIIYRGLYRLQSGSSCHPSCPAAAALFPAINILTLIHLPAYIH